MLHTSIAAPPRAVIALDRPTPESPSSLIPPLIAARSHGSDDDDGDRDDAAGESDLHLLHHQRAWNGEKMSSEELDGELSERILEETDPDPFSGSRLDSRNTRKLKTKITKAGRSKAEDAAAGAGEKLEMELPNGSRAMNDRALETAREEISGLKEQLARSQERERGYLVALRAYAGETMGDERSSGSLGSGLEEITDDLRSTFRAKTDQDMFWIRTHEDAQYTYRQMENEVRSLRAELEDQDKVWKGEWERKSAQLLLERDRCRAASHAAQKAVLARDEEVRELRKQLLALKHSISTWRRTEGQVTDDVLTEKFRTLGHDLQNWTINHFRRASLDSSCLSDRTKADIASTVPSYEMLLATNVKLHVIQAVISSIIVREIFACYYFGLSSDHVVNLQELEAYFWTIAPPIMVNKWRAAALSMVRHGEDKAIQARMANRIDIIESRINGLLYELTDAKPSDARHKGLQSIVQQAVELSQILRIQYAQFKVDIPFIGGADDDDDDDEVEPHDEDDDEEGDEDDDDVDDDPLIFDGMTMEDVTAEDEDALGDRDVRCVIFPCVVKYGDEEGNNLHLRNVLVKAKVLRC
ncbi:MAG: hypothetical protein M1826_002005 [Phylliscum demangeonii]|nr:MAG: hypothetical protein M1826_002005 [Phylliscum demangeonii]